MIDNKPQFKALENKASDLARSAASSDQFSSKVFDQIQVLAADLSGLKVPRMAMVGEPGRGAYMQLETGALNPMTAQRIGALCKELSSQDLPKDARIKLTSILQGHLKMATTSMQKLQDKAGGLSFRESVVFDQALSVLADMSRATTLTNNKLGLNDIGSAGEFFGVTEGRAAFIEGLSPETRGVLDRLISLKVNETIAGNNESTAHHEFDNLLSAVRGELSYGATFCEKAVPVLTYLAATAHSKFVRSMAAEWLQNPGKSQL
jgi:hypothetical protein